MGKEFKVNYKGFKGFGGNRNLKNYGVEIEWTPELLEEYIRCSEDPIYFINNYVKIINLDEGLVNFDLRPYQVEAIKSLNENRFTILMQSRQSGKTIAVAGFILWYVIFNSDKTVGILANKEDTANEIVNRIQLAFEYLPLWLQQGVREMNKSSFSLENESRVLAGSTSSASIRGKSINLLYVDECAHIDHFDEFWSSVYPTISSGQSTKCIISSTPYGLNHFWKFVKESKEKKNRFRLIEVPWTKVPGRDEKWRQEEIINLGSIDRFNQEHNLEFQGSSGTLIAGWKLKELSWSSPLINFHPGLELSMYKNPEKDHSYTLIADVSSGKGFDYSAFHVIDITKMPFEQVCTFHNNTIPTIEFAQVIHQAAKMYNNAWILVENKVMGGEVCNSLWYDFEYEYLIYSESGGRNGKKATITPKRTAEIGINTSVAVKAVGCSTLKLLIEQNQLLLHDEATMGELNTFSKKGKSFEAEEGKFDDLVMGLVLFAWFSVQDIFKELTDTNTIAKLRLKSEEELMDDLVPFGMNINGTEGLDDIIDIGSYDIDAWLMNENTL